MSYALTGIAMCSTWLLSRQKRIGWVVGASMQALWAAYGVITHQWGFLIGAVIFGWLNIQGWRRWGAHSTETETDHLVHDELDGRPR